jgi:hypothetical protein
VKQWYPDPRGVDVNGTFHGTLGQNFNAYNLDPFVWLVHKKMGLSGYGFSLDDDAADISGNFATKLGVSIGGLNGLPNHFEWSDGAPYGPVSGTATIAAAKYPENTGTPLNEIKGLPPYSFFALRPYDANAKVLGANLSNAGDPAVPANTSLLDFGNGGLYTYSYIPTDKHPPEASDPLSKFTVGNSYLFTMLGNGTADAALTAGNQSVAAPYMNTLNVVSIPFGSTLTTTAVFGSLTSYTQQYEELARVSMVPTVALHTPDDPFAPKEFVANAPLPALHTIVNGTLDSARVEIADGGLSGTGKITGVLNVYGPVGGYANPIVSVGIDPHPDWKDELWNNPSNVIKGTNGGFLVAGDPEKPEDPLKGGTPGKLTVEGDVSMYGASFVVYAKGTTQGSDYSYLDSDGKVHLGNSKLDLSLLGYTPQTGHSLTIINAAQGITGKFSQGNSITVNGFPFTITYNANSVVLTPGPKAVAPPPLAAAPPAPVPQDPYPVFVQTLYRDVLKRLPRPAELNRWVRFLRSGGARNAVAMALVTLPAYLRKHPTAASFVKGLYRDVLGRLPPPRGVAAWVGFARAHPGDWAALAQAFLSAPGPRTRLRELFDQAALS